MVTAKEIDRQLKNIGVSFWFFGNAELRELRHILVEGEVIEHCILGHYEGGYAVLCATNLRLLLIDKKPFYLTLEDVRYDMIVEVDFANRLFDATIKICSPNKTLNFTAYKKHVLRLMVAYIQHRVIEFRQQHAIQSKMGQSQSAWQPQALFTQSLPPEPRSMKQIAQFTIDKASKVVDAQPLSTFNQSTNPYISSSFSMRQPTPHL